MTNGCPEIGRDQEKNRNQIAHKLSTIWLRREPSAPRSIGRPVSMWGIRSANPPIIAIMQIPEMIVTGNGTEGGPEFSVGR